MKEIPQRLYAEIQDASGIEGRDILRGERNLCAAMLERAILDAASTSIPRRKGTGECWTPQGSKAWLRLEDEIDADELIDPPAFSFIWVCQHLNLCPLLLRKQLIPHVRTLSAFAKERRDLKQRCDLPRVFAGGRPR